MTELTMGANAPLAGDRATVVLTLPSGAKIDVSALLTYTGGKVQGDGDMCFYNQKSAAGGAMVLESGPPPQFTFQLDKVPPAAEKIVLTAAIDGAGDFGSLAGELKLQAGDIALPVPLAGKSESALILAEIYRRTAQQWKIRNVSQGFTGGMRALAEHFGVEISEAPAATASPAPAAPASTPSPTPAANTVSLTKENKTVSLSKADGKFSEVKINLNWNQAQGHRTVDLDLGAFVEGRTGAKTVVQALGNRFGNLNLFPHVQLLGDDRTGAAADGEWLHLNGDKWGELRRVLVFAYIYEGAANWRETDGVVRVQVPGEPEIEVRMNEFGSNDKMCCVATIENDGGAFKVNREVRFFKGHSAMDQDYGWNFSWTKGSKS